MFLSNPRHRLIYFCLLGMEMAWIVPFLLLFYRPLRQREPLAVYGVVFGVLLAWVLTIEVMNRFIRRSPHFEVAVTALIGLTSLLGLRLIVYLHRAWFDLTWPIHALQALIDLEHGLALEWVVILLNFFLWLRATNATSREIDFWNVGLSFRMGMLLLIVGGGLLYQYGAVNGMVFLWLYFTFGLTAVALTRINEKATDMRSVGPLLPPNRLAQLLLMVAGTMTLTLWLTTFYNPETLRSLIRWSLPLLELLGRVVFVIVTTILWLLGPILLWIGQLFVNLFALLDFSMLADTIESFRQALAATTAENTNEPSRFAVPGWVWVLLRYVGVTVFLVFCVGLIVIFLDKIRPQSARDEAETTDHEAVTFGGNALQEGLAWLGDLARLVGRYGVGRQLLAAISVENIYANLCRIARKQGYPRHPAQPPDAYLATLSQVFMDQEAPLARITISYMRVHYGGRTLTPAEVEQVRADYDLVRKSRRRAE